MIDLRKVEVGWADSSSILSPLMYCILRAKSLIMDPGVLIHFSSVNLNINYKVKVLLRLHTICFIKTIYTGPPCL